MDGDFFVGAALSTTLMKLALRYVALTKDKKRQNTFIAESMLIMASIIHLGKSGLPAKTITDDDLDRIATCIRSLWEQSPLMFDIYTNACRQSLSDMLTIKAAEEKEYAKSKERKTVRVQADDPIGFIQLVAKNELGVGENMFDLTLSQALGMTAK